MTCMANDATGDHSRSGLGSGIKGPGALLEYRLPPVFFANFWFTSPDFFYTQGFSTMLTTLTGLPEGAHQITFHP